jgi:hypothetical protein
MFILAERTAAMRPRTLQQILHCLACFMFGPAALQYTCTQDRRGCKHKEKPLYHQPPLVPSTLRHGKEIGRQRISDKREREREIHDVRKK